MEINIIRSDIVLSSNREDSGPRGDVRDAADSGETTYTGNFLMHTIHRASVQQPDLQFLVLILSISTQHICNFLHKKQLEYLRYVPACKMLGDSRPDVAAWSRPEKYSHLAFI